MLSYITISTDSVNNGKLIEATLPDNDKKRVLVRFASESPTTQQESEAIDVVLNELESAYNQGLL